MTNIFLEGYLNQGMIYNKPTIEFHARQIQEGAASLGIDPKYIPKSAPTNASELGRWTALGVAIEDQLIFNPQAREQVIRSTARSYLSLAETIGDSGLVNAAVRVGERAKSRLAA